MSDRDAFLRAIADSPDDDAPRLVFADWLDEHGEPERAEFIRLQCRLRIDAPLEQFRAGRRREIALLTEHGERWLGPWREFAEARRFDRGFLGSAR